MEWLSPIMWNLSDTIYSIERRFLFEGGANKAHKTTLNIGLAELDIRDYSYLVIFLTVLSI